MEVALSLRKDDLSHAAMALAVIWSTLVTGCRDVHADEFAANLPADVRAVWDHEQGAARVDRHA